MADWNSLVSTSKSLITMEQIFEKNFKAYKSAFLGFEISLQNILRAPERLVVLDNKTRDSVTRSEKIWKLVQKTSNQACEYATRSTLLTAGIVVAVTVFAVFYVIIFSRRMASRVAGIEATMRRVTDNNFTVRTSTNTWDEIGCLGQNINYILDITQEFFSTTKLAYRKVGELKKSLSSSTEQSISSLHQISKNIEAIRIQFSRLSENVANTSQALEEITRSMYDLAREVEQTVQCSNGSLLLHRGDE